MDGRAGDDHLSGGRSDGVINGGSGDAVEYGDARNRHAARERFRRRTERRRGQRPAVRRLGPGPPGRHSGQARRRRRRLLHQDRFGHARRRRAQITKSYTRPSARTCCLEGVTTLVAPLEVQEAVLNLAEDSSKRMRQIHRAPAAPPSRMEVNLTCCNPVRLSRISQECSSWSLDLDRGAVLGDSETDRCPGTFYRRRCVLR